MPTSSSLPHSPTAFWTARKSTFSPPPRRNGSAFSSSATLGAVTNGKVMLYISLGRWSEYSDVWSEELRHELDYEKADDSIMWINVEDMLKNFGQVCACKYNSDYINTSL